MLLKSLRRSKLVSIIVLIMDDLDLLLLLLLLSAISLAHFTLYWRFNLVLSVVRLVVAFYLKDLEGIRDSLLVIRFRLHHILLQDYIILLLLLSEVLALHQRVLILYLAICIKNILIFLILRRINCVSAGILLLLLLLGLLACTIRNLRPFIMTAQFLKEANFLSWHWLLFAVFGLWWGVLICMLFIKFILSELEHFLEILKALF